MNEFRKYVKENEKWFSGKFKETDESLNAVEKELEIKLPDDIRWLLKEYGYWHGTGISNMEDSIHDTKNARTYNNLPRQFVVLFYHHDGGVILLDTEENKVYNAAWESIPDNLQNEIIFESYLDYVKDVILTESKTGD